MSHTNAHTARAGTDRAAFSSRRLLSAALTTMLALVLFALLAPVALALPEGRVYEMVSPPYKAGYGVGVIEAVAPNGEAAAFRSSGVFAGTDSSVVGATYLARRGGFGWVTTPLETPSELVPTVGVEDFSSTFEAVLSKAFLGTNVGSGEITTENEFLLHRIDAPDTVNGWEVAGGLVLKSVKVTPVSLELGEEGASADLCHIVIESDPVHPLLLLAAGVGDQLYDLSAGCGGEPGLSLIGLNNKGELLSPCGIQLEGTGRGSKFNVISADGSEIFFTTPYRCNGNTSQVFVRLGGSRTLEVSRPLDEVCDGEVPCPGAASRPSAEFAGASEDASRVFFTTAASLSGADVDAGNDLYMAEIGCPEGGECEASQRQVISLVQVSHDPHVGEAADVQNVVRVAPDGSRVYFVARGVLSEEANTEGSMPVKGADNLYVYDGASKSVAFVADLCSGPVVSGEVEDGHCPNTLDAQVGARNDTGLWTGAGGEVQSTKDGEFLVFATYARLLAHGGEADTDSARDIYRYDAASGALNRVSLGEDGTDANGNGAEPTLGAFDATIKDGNLDSAKADSTYELGNRAVSEDGSRIVFTSAEPLSPAVSNGLANVYEWHLQEDGAQGGVFLISSGSAPEPDSDPVITPSGHDIFFLTTQGLAGQDSDGQSDVYDARLEGGFAVPPTPLQPCSGDACHGPLTNPVPLLVAGSVSQAPGGNFFAPAASKRAVKATTKKKAKKKHKKKVKVSHKLRGTVKSAGRSGR